MSESATGVATTLRTPLPSSWRRVQLGEVCEINPKRPEIRRADDAQTSFVPMSAVLDRGRGIETLEARPFLDIRKGYTCFGEGDVLFAKITPCMQNGKHTVARGLIDGLGFGSTEFHVLRSRGEVLPEWLHLFLIQPHILEDATAHFTGAVGQRRVPEEYLADLSIPLPPMPEQERIVFALASSFSAAEHARAAAEAQLEAAKALPAAYLREVFESKEARGWPVKSLGSVCILGPDNGVFKRRHEFGEGVPIVNVSDLYRGFAVDISLLERVQVSSSELRRYSIAPGDLFFCRSSLKREGIGRCCLALGVSEPSVFDCHVMRVRLDARLLDSAFIAHYMSHPSVRELIIGNSRTATMTTMNQEDLAAIQVPVPPLHDQRKIASSLTDLCRKSASLQQAIERQLLGLNHVPAALLRVTMS